MGRHLTSKERSEVVAEVAGGKTYKEVAEARGLHASTISRIMKRKRPRTIVNISRGATPLPSHSCARCKKLEIAPLDMIIKM